MRPSGKKSGEEVDIWFSSRLLAFRFTEQYSGCRLQMLFKISPLKDFATFTGKQLWWSVFLMKLQVLQVLQLYWKGTPTQVFSCEYCQFFKNSFFYRTPPVAVSENMDSFTITLKGLSNSKSIFSKKISRRLHLNSKICFKNRCLLNLQGFSFCILDIQIFLVPNNLSKSPLSK